MNKDSIITVPHPSLRTKSKRVSNIDNEILEIINGMRSATLDWEKSREHELGVALAAVQINALVKVVIIRKNTDDKNDETFNVLINPEIIRYSDDTEYDHEGCLSIPDIYGLVPRATKIKIRALDTKGHQIRLNAEGFAARVLQHEIDHLHGKLFIDHIRDDSDAFFKLDPSGELEPMNYETTIKNNVTLWYE